MSPAAGEGTTIGPWTVTTAAELRPVAFNWLWPGYLARGKLAVLDGDPEVGKSLLTTDLAARLTRGGPLPDGAPLPRPGAAVLLSAEDDPADTTLPRAVAAGADLARLVLPTHHERTPAFPADLPALEELVRDHAAELVVIDPLMAFLPPRVAANLDQCVRQALTPLAELAARTGAAVVCVRHLTKKESLRAVYRGQGSVGIVAAARTALLAARHPADPTRGVLTVSKSNVGEKPPALGFRVESSPAGPPVVVWDGPADVTADAACKPSFRPRDRATDWLKQQLANGPVPAATVYAAAAAAGIPDRTLQRAKGELPAASRRVHDSKTGQGEWYWYDPDAAWPADAPFRRPRELPPLPDL